MNVSHARKSKDSGSNSNVHSDVGRHIVFLSKIILLTEICFDFWHFLVPGEHNWSNTYLYDTQSEFHFKLCYHRCTWRGSDPNSLRRQFSPQWQPNVWMTDKCSVLTWQLLTMFIHQRCCRLYIFPDCWKGERLYFHDNPFDDSSHCQYWSSMLTDSCFIIQLVLSQAAYSLITWVHNHGLLQQQASLVCCLSSLKEVNCGVIEINMKIYESWEK